MRVTIDIAERLRAAGLGERVLSGPAQLAAFGSDGLTAFNERAAAVVMAESIDDVVAAVRTCHDAGVPFVPRGSGTSLSGGSVPIAGGVVIALNRMDRIVRVDPEARIAVVQPGVINLQVSAATAAHGLQYAPDPSSQSVCSIGGNLAFNSGGAHCLKHGMTSNHVLGLKVVLPDGELVELGADHLGVVGPDWTGVFCGCEGLFGIAVEVTLRLIPIPEAVCTSLAAYDSLQAAGEAVARIVREGMLPVAMEIMDALAMEAAEASVKPGYPACAALLIVELEGEQEVVDADRDVLDALLRESGALHVRSTADPAERALIWKGRKSAFSAVGWLSPDYIVQDGVVPRTRLGEVLAEIERMSKARGIRVANVFHAGDGNLHPLILYDGREQAAAAQAHALAGEILRLCVAVGGSITGEHGVGLEKLEYLPLMFSPDDLELMRRLRRAVDPEQLANRGKMLEVAAVIVAATSIQDVEEAVRSVGAGLRLLPVAGGTKPALSRSDREDVEQLDVSGLSGITEYDPAELTLTALAGTPLREIEAALAEHGQYLPFDPPLVAAGATLGGAVAAGASGARAWRHGTIRDFTIGVRFVDGTGRLISGGGKVVKNAAGFDLPKLMVGSAGRLGIMVQLSLKVFPRPAATTTVAFKFDTVEGAVGAVTALARGPVELEALDLLGDGTVLARIGGRTEALGSRADRLMHGLAAPAHRYDGEAELTLWSETAALTWPPVGSSVVRVGLAIHDLVALHRALDAVPGAAVRYGIGGTVAWIGWPQQQQLDTLETVLRRTGLSATTLVGPPDRPFLGAAAGGAFAARIVHALDPESRFLEI